MALSAIMAIKTAIRVRDSPCKRRFRQKSGRTWQNNSWWSIYRIAPIFLFDYAGDMETKALTPVKSTTRRHFLATGLAATMIPSETLAETDIIAHVKAPRMLGRITRQFRSLNFSR